MTKWINSVASAIAWHVSSVFRATLCFGTAEGTFLGYAQADSHGGSSTPVLKSNFKASSFGWCTYRQCHDNWHALGWKICSRLRHCICIMHVCFRACTSLRWKNVCVCCPGFFVGYCTSLFFRVSVNPSGITVPSKPCQLSQVNVVRFHSKNTHAEPIWVLEYTWGRVQKHATPWTPGDSCPMEEESHLFLQMPL